MEVFLKDQRGLTIEDVTRLGYNDREAVLTIIFCPICGLDKCSTQCHLPRGEKLHFRLQSEEALV